MREFIGVIKDATGRIVAVINPDDDSELDNAGFLQMGQMVRVPRAKYQTLMSPDDLAELLQQMAEAP
jgi:hypothetical protein